MARCEKVWGKDAKEYRPERFNEDVDSNLKDLTNSRNQYKYVAFNAGPRLCLGKVMAGLEVKTFISTLLKRYKFTPSGFRANQNDELFDKVQEQYITSPTLSFRDGLTMTVSR